MNRIHMQHGGKPSRRAAKTTPDVAVRLSTSHRPPAGAPSAALQDVDATNAARVCRRWTEAYVALDSRVRAAQILSMGVSGSQSSAQLDWWLADLDAVREALYELHVCVVDARLRPWICPRSALVAYLNAAYVWCGDVVSDVLELVREFNRGTWRWHDGRAAFIEESSDYIERFLDPLFGDLALICRATPTPQGAALDLVLRSAERLQAAILTLNWSLCA